jgi:hypothetical protein
MEIPPLAPSVHGVEVSALGSASGSAHPVHGIFVVAADDDASE